MDGEVQSEGVGWVETECASKGVSRDLHNVRVRVKVRVRV